MIWQLEELILSKIVEQDTVFCEIITKHNLKVTLTQPPEKLKKIYHFATNFAMLVAPKMTASSMQIALQLEVILRQIDFIADVNISQPGFINIALKDVYFYNLISSLNSVTCIEELLIKQNAINNNDKNINIEFVSANPTGPLHIAHLRGAVLGDVLSTIFSKVGYKVTREYYINDAGRQLDILLESVEFRIAQYLGQKPISEELPPDCYPGDYVKEIAEKLLDTKLSKRNISEIVMNVFIKPSLEKLGIKHDVFTSEQSLIDRNMLELIEQRLNDLHMLYRGFLDKPRGVDVDDYEPAELLLIKTQQFGDDNDRALKKRDGTWTYIAPDIAYHYDKFSRGFSNMIVILGEDHKGYVKRLTAGTLAVTNQLAKIDIKLCGIVNFVKGDAMIRMSKRKNNFLTINDMIDALGADSLRFLILTRRAETVLNFDLEVAKSHTKDNPLFYIQYAHSRCHSAIQMLNTRLNNIDGNIEINQNANIPAEYKEVLCSIMLYSKAIENSIKNLDPYFFVDYAIQLTTLFHNLWSAGNINHELRFFNNTIPNEQAVFNKQLLTIVHKTLASCLLTTGIKPLDRM